MQSLLVISTKHKTIKASIPIFKEQINAITYIRISTFYFFFLESESRYFKLSGVWGLHHHYSALPLKLNLLWTIHKWMNMLCSYKTLFVGLWTTTIFIECKFIPNTEIENKTHLSHNNILFLLQWNAHLIWINVCIWNSENPYIWIFEKSLCKSLNWFRLIFITHYSCYKTYKDFIECGYWILRNCSVPK